MVLVTAPPAAANDDALYRLLKRTRGAHCRDRGARIEFQLSGINQIQVEAADRLQLPHSLLRSILRQDPTSS